MNDFKKMVVDTIWFKVVLGAVSLLSICTIIFNISETTFSLFLYVPISILYSNMYSKNNLKATNKKTIILNTCLYVLSLPGLLLYKLVCIVFNMIIGIAKVTTPKFRPPHIKPHRRKKC